jgi:ubiquinone/menaquinone biosynthesis C-methylase UbiE
MSTNSIESYVSEQVKTAYDECYLDNDNGWRTLCASYKTNHIIEVCKGLKFKKTLEVGAGDGSILKMLANSGFSEEYYAVEISKSGVDQISSKNIKNLKSVQLFDGYNLPFDDNSFDLIILSHVLEHVEHERLLLHELNRVANYSVIEVPLDYKPGVDKRIKHFLAYGHINVYTPTSLRYLLYTEHFEIVNNLTDVISPVVLRFNKYVNQKKSKNIISDFKISIFFFLRNNLGKIFGKQVNEYLANSYTVLVKKADSKSKIF